MANAPAAIAAVSQTESAPVRDERTPIIKETNCLNETAVPYKFDSLFFVDIEIDYKELIESLRHKTNLNEVSVRDATVVFRNTDDDLKVWQLSPLAGTLLRLCDGQRTVAEITNEFSGLGIEIDVPLEKVVVFGLMQLIEDEFIGLSASPLIWEGDAMTSAYSLPPKASNTQQPWPADRH
jgi:hypothetical protein